MEVTRRDLAALLIREQKFQSLIDFVCQRFPKADTSNKNTRKQLRCFTLHFRNLWRKSSRSKERFFGANTVWLDGTVVLETKERKSEKRKLKAFSELCRRSKLRRVQALTENHTTQELVTASALSVARDGSRNTGKRIEHLAQSSKSASEPTGNIPTVEEYSPEQALCFICRNNFSRMQYQDVRMTTLEKGISLYPSYNKVLLAKQDTYPEGNVSI